MARLVFNDETENEISLSRYFKSPAVRVPLLVLAVIILLSVCSFAINGVEDSELYLTVIIAQLIIFLIPAILYYQLRSRKLDSNVYIRPFRSVHIVFTFFSTVVFFSGNMLIKYFSYIIFGETGKYRTYFIDAAFNADDLKSIGVFLAFCLVPAVCEELFFRGIVLSEYRKFGAFNCVFISALFFAFIHLSFNDFFSYLFSGLVLGFVTVSCRSVFPAILIHFLNNVWSIYGSDTFINLIVQESGAFFLTFILVISFCVSVIVVLGYLLKLYSSYEKNPPDGDLPSRSIENLSEVYLSPTFYIVAILYFFITLLSK